MHQEIVRRTTADNLRSGRSAQALHELIDLLLNGYACVFQLALCAMYMRWIDYTEYDTTVAKALPKMLAKKMNLALLFAVLRQNVISVVTNEMTKPGGMVYAHILQHMDNVKNCVQRLLHPLINDPNVTVAATWSRAALLCRVNREIAATTRAKQPYARLGWHTQAFEFQLNQDIVNKARYGRSLDGLTDEQRTQLVMVTTTKAPAPTTADTSTIAMLQSTLATPSGAGSSPSTQTPTKGRCFQCGQLHKAASCPKLSPAIRHALATAESAKVQASAAKRAKAKAAARANRNQNARKHQQFRTAQYVQQGVAPTMYMPQPLMQGIPATHLQLQTPMMREYNRQQFLGAPNQPPPMINNQPSHNRPWQAQPAPKRQRPNLPGAKFYVQGQTGLTIKPQFASSTVCYHFEQQRCRFAGNPMECMHPHFCRRCKATDHGIFQCPNQNGPV